MPSLLRGKGGIVVRSYRFAVRTSRGRDSLPRSTPFVTTPCTAMATFGSLACCPFSARSGTRERRWLWSAVLLGTFVTSLVGCRPRPALREQNDVHPSAAASASTSLPTYLPPSPDDDGWSVAAADAVGLSVEKLGAMERSIRAGDFPKLTSVLIARRGKLVYEGYFNEADRGTLHDTRSATKTVAGMLLGIAIERGLVAGVDAKVTTFFADKRPFANSDQEKERMTIEDLLTMSSALECNDWNEESRGNEERMYVQKDWVKFALDLPVRKPAARQDAGLRGAASSYGTPHDRGFSYCTAGVGLLGVALKRAVKMPLVDFAKAALFDPLGIARAAWQFSPAGDAFTGGGLGLRSRDLLKLAELYLEGGTWKGRRIVSEDWVKRSITPHARIDDKTEYGYLWWLRSFSANGKTWPAWFMSGNGGNKVIVVPDLRLVAVLSSVNYNGKGMHVVTDRLLQQHILAAVID